MHDYTIIDRNGNGIFLTAKNFRVDKTGSLIIIGKRFATLAVYPAGYWQSITQHA
jgi:hypothetical protein